MKPVSDLKIFKEATPEPDARDVSRQMRSALKSALQRQRSGSCWSKDARSLHGKFLGIDDQPS